MNNPFVFLKLLRRANHTVFGVSDGQKRYFDPVFQKSQPYASGQQVKRSIMEAISLQVNQPLGPVTYVWSVSGKLLSEGEVLSACDPRFPDLLFGGWMSAPNGGGKQVLKRRSPLSISAFKPLHPLLASVMDKEAMTHDRSSKPENNKVVVYERGKGAIPNRILTDQELDELLTDNHRSLHRKWIPEDKNRRLSGLFVEEIAIDLRTLFTVSLSEKEPEITRELAIELQEQGWIRSKNAFGSCLIAPRSIRNSWIPALASALIEWKISTNQANKYSPQDTLAVAIGQNASTIGFAIRARLTDQHHTQAEPVIDSSIQNVPVFKTPLVEEYMFGQTGEVAAIDQAKDELSRLLSGFDYENQM
ncbi:CRISPR-associated protein Cas7 [Spirosoma litoris]